MTRIRRPLRAACTLAAAALTAAVAAPAHATPPPLSPTARTERVSVGLGQAQPDGASAAGGLSADGRFAVFTSDAANLVPGDTNGKSDVFVRDLWTGRTERVDTGPDHAQADGDSFEATISGNGRYVAFSSSATNLAPGANLGAEDVYVHDRWTGETRLVSTGKAPGAPQTQKVSGHPSISWDGRSIAYQSNRSDLAPGTVTWFGGNIYVADLRSGGTTLVSIGADGKEADSSSAEPEISADGRTVVFISKATNLIAGGQPGALSPSAVAELAAGSDAQFTADSLRPAARPKSAAPGITKPRLYPLYVRDLNAGRTSLASPDGAGGYRGVANPSISPDGRFAVYSSWVLHGDSQWDRHFEVYARDLKLGTETLISTGLPGTKTTESSYAGRMTADDRWVFFSSTADNLVPGDTNQASDIFRHDRWTGRTERVDLANDGSQGAGSEAPFVNAFGTAVVFTSSDGALVPGDSNNAADVFVRHLRLF
ncbi:TolB family protein [Kitasatospora sp. NPDC093550]|uniref:TolB family protein n=1 Tax=Kitasatospora sp. NPDC093550 TaxID=3364089 RepID=UPI00382360AC